MSNVDATRLYLIGTAPVGYLLLWPRDEPVPQGWEDVSATIGDGRRYIQRVNEPHASA